MKKGLFVFTIFCFFVYVKGFCQVGSTCGIPTWYASVQYSNVSVVEHNGTIYKSTQWSSGAEPGKGGEWISLGVCNEQLIINNPGLAYISCSKANDWDSSTANYNTGDLVRYNNGVYKANYWVAGTEHPDISAAYTYMGVCVIPIDITPAYTDGQLIILSSLTAVNLSATINTHAFTLASSKIEIKKVTATTYTTYSTTASGNTITSSWTPAEYTDYNIRYTCVNSVGVSSVINTTVKVAVSQPPSISITNPENNSSFVQLNFAPVNINFTVQPASGNSISTVTFKDLAAGTSNNVSVTSNGIYTYVWTPQNYGTNNLQILTTDNKGTSVYSSFAIKIVNPASQTLTFSTLPNQLKAVYTIDKTFTFDKQITSVKRRDTSLFDCVISNNTLKIVSKKPGRTGVVITTSDGTKYYAGIRIDKADGTVPRYPDHVSVGSVSEDIPDDVNFFNDGIDEDNLLKNNRMDVRYIYINGGPTGGWSSWQPDRAIKFTRNSLKMGLIPFFVFYNIPDGGESYTTDLEHARSASYMKAYFENLYLFLGQVKDELDDEFFGVILEPDFLGYMQQNNESVNSLTAVNLTTIGENVGTLQTLVKRINYEMDNKRKTDKLNMEFGWQLNLWAKGGVAGLRGIIRETDTGTFSSQLAKIRQTAVDIFNYGKNMGIMTYGADFISIDKYGLDAMGAPTVSNPADPSTYTWFWNNDHWMNYLEFVESLNVASGKPVILWQVPVGHINGSQTKNAYTGTSFETLSNTLKRYEDSASTFFFGDVVDFSNDNVRFSYFGQNKHADPKLIVDAATKKITFGNHFQEVKQCGSHLVLMGAGVGDSTDGIGKFGETLTDDHYWIQKLQDYYLNHLVPVDPSTHTPEDVIVDSPLIYPNPASNSININMEGKNVSELILIDVLGNKVMSLQNPDNTIDISSLSKGAYIVIVKLTTGKFISNKIVKL